MSYHKKLTAVSNDSGNSYLGLLSHSNTANRSYTLPDKDGTLATLDDIASGSYAALNGSSTQAFSGSTITASTQFSGPGTGLTGTAASLTAGLATKLATARTISLTGDVTASGSFDGSANVSLATSIADSVITGGLLTGYAVGSNTALAATDTILSSLGKIQAQLNNKQASGSYLTGITSSQVTSALGYTPANKAGDIFTGKIDQSFVTTDGQSVNDIHASMGVNTSIKFANVEIGGQTLGLAYLKWARDTSQGRSFSVFTCDSSGNSKQALLLDTAGNATLNSLVTAANQSSMLKLRDLVFYTHDVSSSTGTIKITLPKSWTNTMMRVTIDGYDYSSSNGVWQVIVSGYSYADSPLWVNPTYQINGRAPFTSVRLAHDGTNCCILLGNTSTALAYPKITLSEVLIGYSNFDASWSTGWSISRLSSETGISYIATPTCLSLNTLLKDTMRFYYEAAITSAVSMPAYRIDTAGSIVGVRCYRNVAANEGSTTISIRKNGSEIYSVVAGSGDNQAWKVISTSATAVAVGDTITAVVVTAGGASNLTIQLELTQTV